MSNLGYELYKVNTQIADLWQMWEDSQESDDDREALSLEDIRETLEMLEMDRDDLIEQEALLYKNLQAEVTACANEIENFKRRKEAAEAKMEGISAVLTKLRNGEKFETGKVKISFRNTKAVQVDDINLVPNEYKRVSFEKMVLAEVPVEMIEHIKDGSVEACKKDIAKMLKEDVQIPGVTLVTNQSITIK